MKRYVFAFLLFVALPLSTAAQQTYHSRAKDCMFTRYLGTVTRTFSLLGRVRVVNGNEYADLRVKVVTDKRTAVDLEVAIVTGKATCCGEWLFVKKDELFTIKYVDDFEDITIRFVKRSELSKGVPY